MGNKTIIVTAHIDHNFNQTGLRLDQVATDDSVHLEGTLDNLIGCMALSRFWKYLSDHGHYFFYTQDEEAGQSGARKIASEFNKEDVIVINIDVDEIDDPHVLCGIDNINGFSDEEIKDLNETILYWFSPWQQNIIQNNFYKNVKNDSDFQDDSWVFANHGFKVFTLTCPVQGNFHATDATIDINAFERYCRCLECVIKYFVDEIENTKEVVNNG